VLDAPTNDAWLTPWAGHLRSAGVELRLGEAVEGIHVQNGRIAGVTVAGGRRVVADYYVAALPVEVMRALLSPELRAAEPRLNGLDRLVTRWMNGILFYLGSDLPLVHGHELYIDSEWALTSISQRQFWRGVDFARLGDGSVNGILSVDISEWQRPGTRTGKVAAQCTREEIRAEVWGQLHDHLGARLDGVDVRAWFLDEDIEFPIRPAPRTPSRCSSTPPARGPTGPTRRRGSPTCCSPPTTCARTPISRPWRAPTRPPAAPSTRSSTRPARRRPAAACGRCASRRCSLPRRGAGQAALEATPGRARCACAASGRSGRPAWSAACSPRGPG
jgi:hypothetical protein